MTHWIAVPLLATLAFPPSELPQLRDDLRSASPRQRERALRELCRLDEAARPAGPDVVCLLNDPTTDPVLFGDACHILSRIADPGEIDSVAAIQALVRVLEHPQASRDDKQSACWALFVHGRHARLAVPQLSQLLQECDPVDRPDEMQLTAMMALGQCGEAGVPALAQVLTDRRHDHFINAAANLGNLGKAARSAIPALRRGLGDTDVFRRYFTALALLRVSSEPEPHAVRVLGQLLDSKPVNRRLQSLNVLGRLGPRAAPAVPDLCRLMHDEPEWTSAVLRVLARIGLAAREAAPALRELLERADPALPCVEVAETLWWIDRNRSALAMLLERAESGRLAVRSAAVAALGRIGQDTPNPLIRETLDQVSHRFTGKSAGVLALARARAGAKREERDALREPMDRELLGVLKTLIEVGIADACTAAGVLGPDAGPLVGVLRGTLDTPSTPVPCIEAIRALAVIGPAAQPTVPRLLELARNERLDRRLRVEAMITIARLDRKQGETALLLLVRLDRTNSRERDREFRRLGELGPIAKSVVPVLRQRLAWVNTRSAAAEALWHIDPTEARRLGVSQPNSELIREDEFKVS